MNIWWYCIFFRFDFWCIEKIFCDLCLFMHEYPDSKWIIGDRPWSDLSSGAVSAENIWIQVPFLFRVRVQNYWHIYRNHQNKSFHIQIPMIQIQKIFGNLSSDEENEFDCIKRVTYQRHKNSHDAFYKKKNFHMRRSRYHFFGSEENSDCEIYIQNTWP